MPSAAASQNQRHHHWKPANPAPRLQVWSTKNIDGVHRFLARVWRLIAEQGTSNCEPSQDQMRLLHATIKKVCVLWLPEGTVCGVASVRKARGIVRIRCACCMPLSQSSMPPQACCSPCHTLNGPQHAQLACHPECSMLGSLAVQSRFSGTPVACAYTHPALVSCLPPVKQ